MADAKLAVQIGLPAHVVTFKRHSLKIPHYSGPKKSRVSWTPAEIRLLGKLADDEVAGRINRSVAAVIQRRELLHIPKPNPKLTDWTAAEDKVLGTRPDDEIAHRLKRTLSGVSHRRVRLKIPACRVRSPT